MVDAPDAPAGCGLWGSRHSDIRPDSTSCLAGRQGRSEACAPQLAPQCQPQWNPRWCQLQKWSWERELLQQSGASVSVCVRGNVVAAVEAASFIRICELPKVHFCWRAIFSGRTLFPLEPPPLAIVVPDMSVVCRCASHLKTKRTKNSVILWRVSSLCSQVIRVNVFIWLYILFDAKETMIL